MQEDTLFIRQAQKGDVRAFEALMARHEKKIYGLCLRMLGNREDALDCAQDAMLRIWRSIAAYRMDASFTTWCFRIATNACLDLLRKQKIRTSVSLDMLTDLGRIPAAETGDPHAQAIAADTSRALGHGIASLPADLRSAVVLRDIQGFSYEEVADILGIPLGTVKSRINRGREKLRGILFQDAELFSLPRVQMDERRIDA